MKRLLYVLCGAVLFGAIGYVGIQLFANWYGLRFVRSDEDIGMIYSILLGVLGVCLLAGGISGGMLYGRRRRSGQN
jgi:hypothetical protein